MFLSIATVLISDKNNKNIPETLTIHCFQNIMLFSYFWYWNVISKTLCLKCFMFMKKIYYIRNDQNTRSIKIIRRKLRT